MDMKLRDFWAFLLLDSLQKHPAGGSTHFETFPFRKTSCHLPKGLEDKPTVWNPRAANAGLPISSLPEGMVEVLFVLLAPLSTSPPLGSEEVDWEPFKLGATGGILWGPSWPGWGSVGRIGLGLPMGFVLVAVRSCSGLVSGECWAC